MRRATIQNEIGNRLAVVCFAHGKAQATGCFKGKIVVEQGLVETDMGIGDGPQKIAQGQRIQVGVLLLFSRLELRAELLAFGGPIDALEFGKGILVREFLKHFIEGFGVGQLREIVERGAFGFDQVNSGFGRTVELERRLIHIDHRPARGQIHDRVIIGEEFLVSTKIRWEGLFPIRRVYEIFATKHFEIRLFRVADLGRGVGTGPAAAALVAPFKEWVAPGVGPVSHSKDHHAGLGLAVMVHIMQGAFRLDGQGQAVGKR